MADRSSDRVRLRSGVPRRQSTTLAELHLNPSAPAALIFAKLRQLAPSWLLALLLSAGLVAAGRHWPEPLLEQPWLAGRPVLLLTLVAALVLLPPALLALVLIRALLRHPDRGESSD